MKKQLLIIFLLLLCLSHVCNAGMIIRRFTPEVGGSVILSAELHREDIANNYADKTLTLPVGTSINIGERVVVLCALISTTTTIDSAYDSQSNTYSVDATYMYNGARMAVVSSVLTSPLGASDTITVTVSVTGYSGIDVAVYKITNQTGIEGTTANNGGYGSVITIPGAITISPAVLIGLGNAQSATILTSEWSYSALMNTGGRNVYPMYTTTTAAGAQDPAATLSSSQSWGGVWVAYY